MKPTDDEFKPRRDGYFEHDATWGEVTVGTIIAAKGSRTSTWEVIATSHGGLPVQDGKTLFMRIRSEQTGEEMTLQPRSKLATLTIVTRDPADVETAPPTDPIDSDAIELLVRELGAEIMATRDEITGEITCPDYTWDSHINDGEPAPITRGLIEHMRFAHQMSVDDTLDLVSAMKLHHQAHSPEWPNIGKTGFPHRHVPEVDIQKDFVLQRRPFTPKKGRTK